jgi:hypothetical protein
MNLLECIGCHRFIGRDDHGFIDGEMIPDGDGWICNECLTLEEETVGTDDDAGTETGAWFPLLEPEVPSPRAARWAS